jgi:hypothetical protein
MGQSRTATKKMDDSVILGTSNYGCSVIFTNRIELIGDEYDDVNG